MWSGGEDTSENGKRVLLYQPIRFGKRPTRGISTSFVGGDYYSETETETGGSDVVVPLVDDVPKCARCNRSLKLVLQLFMRGLHSSSSSDGCGGGKNFDRTVQVLACNRASCINELFVEGSLNYGGGGVVVCRRRRRRRSAAGGNNAAREERNSAPDDGPWSRPGGGPDINTSDWSGCNDRCASVVADDAKVDNNDCWDIIDDDANDDVVNMDDLESKLAAIMETAAAGANKQPPATAAVPSKAKKPPPQPHTPTNSPPINQSEITKSSSSSSFPCYELHSILEPPMAPRRQRMDEDDVGMMTSGGGGGTGDDDKIQRMLARYMKEEEDEEILAALRQSANNGGNGIGGGKNSCGGNKSSGGGKRAAGIEERDERLSPHDRAMLAFTDRLKRSPRQVVRFAPGGKPMWSIPPQPKSNNGNAKTTKKRQGTTGGSSPKKFADVHRPIPRCPACGSDRAFAFQVLPSLLHVLEVDKFASSDDHEGGGEKNTPSSSWLEEAFEQGGMDWGNLAVYTCSSATCDDNNNNDVDYVVVQESLDDRPVAPPQQAHHHPSVLDDNFNNNGPIVIEEGATFGDGDDDDDDTFGEDGGSYGIIETETDEDDCYDECW